MALKYQPDLTKIFIHDFYLNVLAHQTKIQDFLVMSEKLSVKTKYINYR